LIIHVVNLNNTVLIIAKPLLSGRGK